MSREYANERPDVLLTKHEAMDIMDAALLVTSLSLAGAGIGAFIYVMHLVSRIT